MPTQGHRREIAAIGSMTQCIKAQRALQGAGLSAQILSLLPSMTRRGCAYGIEYDTKIAREVRALLRRERIPVSQYLEGDPPAP